MFQHKGESIRFACVIIVGAVDKIYKRVEGRFSLLEGKQGKFLLLSFLNFE